MGQVGGHDPYKPYEMGVRALRRRSTRIGARPRRQRPGVSKGQSLVIFALSLTVLIGILGLAVDTVRIYDLYARMERAAEAGALAGVLYLPTNYAVPVPAPGDGKSAISRAIEETVKNGFGTVPPSPLFPDCTNPPNPSVQTVCSACPNPPTSIPVAVCPVKGKPSDLRVTITQTIDVLLLSAVGVGPTTISASAEASYLPTLQLGSRANSFGDEVECSPGNNSLNSNTHACLINDPGQHLQDFEATMTGPADLKESGDPFVYCAEGPADINGINPNNYFYAYNGYPTDHAQWPNVSGNVGTLSPITQYCGAPVPGGKTGNLDQQPSGFDGPATANTAHPGGYNYQVLVTPGNTGSLWLYNPGYVAQDIPQYNSIPTPPDHFVDASYATNFYQGPTGEGIGNRFDGRHYDAPLFYFTTTYSLYQVNNLYDRTTDTLVTSVAYPPYDDLAADLALHGCNPSTQVYNPIWNGQSTPNFYHNPTQIVAGKGCVPAPACMSAWCQVALGQGLNQGTYRLVVEATGLTAITSDYQSTSVDGYGSHAYGVKICDGTGLSTPVGCSAGSNGLGAGQYKSQPGVSVYAWNNMDVIFAAPLSQRSPNKNYPQSSCVTSAATPYACVDLGCIPSQYAGRSIDIRLFDVGDNNGNGSIYVGIVPPSGSGATVSYPNFARTASVDGNTMVDTADGQDRHFNGLWLDAIVTLPASYTGDCYTGNSGWWQMAYASGSNAQPTDKVAVEFNLVGSPIHLTTLG